MTPRKHVKVPMHQAVPRETALRVVAFLAQAYGVNKDDILGESRDDRIAEARHIAVWTMHKSAGLGNSALGRLFGKHNTTARNSIQRVKKLRSERPDVRELSDLLVLRARALQRELRFQALESVKGLAL